MKRALALLALIAIAGLIVWRCRGSSEPPVGDAGVVAPPLTKARLRLRDLQRQQPGTVRGTVTGEQPIANALVCRRPIDDQDDVRCVASDAAGAYELADLRAGAYQLWASAAGFAGARWHAGDSDRLTLKAGEAKTGIDFVLPRGTAEISGRVRDTRGQTIAKALVHVRVAGDPIATTRSDDHGVFRARVDGATAHVEATADGYVDEGVQTVVPATGIELVLVPEATLAGTVVEAGTRTPIPDARIVMEGARLTSGDDGGFRARKLRPGRYKPVASSIGGYGEATESVLLKVGSHVEGVVIEVHPVAVVAGRILVEGTDKGCPENDGSVLLERRGSRELAFGRTILEGDVLIEGVVPGIYAVRLGCTGFVAQASYPDLVVGGTDVEDVVWPVTQGGRLTGRVRTKSGDPVGDAAVTVRAGFGNGARVNTKPDGTFEASGLPAGEVSVEAIQPGYAGATEVKAAISIGRPAHVELVLGDKTGGIAATVIDRAGKPVANARVEARLGTTTAGPSATSNLRGELEITNLDPGSYNLVVASRWQLSSSESRVLNTPVRVRVDRGITARVTVQVDPEDARITGTVVDERGAPVADVAIDVSLTSPDLEPRRRSWELTQAWSVATGAFEIANLPSHPLAVRARIEGANEVIVDNVQPGQHVQLVLPSTGVLAGTVLDPSGASVDDIMLEIEDRAQDITRKERLFHTGGKFRFRDVPAGSYRLTADEDRQTSITVTLAAGERRENLQLSLRPRHAIKGRLVDAAGKPLANYKLEVPHKEAVDETSKGGTIATYEMEYSATNARGEFLIEGLVGAEVTISAGNAAFPDPTMVEIKTVQLVGPSTIDLGDVAMPPPAPE